MTTDNTTSDLAQALHTFVRDIRRAHERFATEVEKITERLERPPRPALTTKLVGDLRSGDRVWNDITSTTRTVAQPSDDEHTPLMHDGRYLYLAEDMAVFVVDESPAETVARQVAKAGTR